MKPNRIEYARRLSVQVTAAMDARLEQIARSRDEAKAEVVRTALRAYLDEQEDLIGSRKHFTKAFGRRVDHLERLMSAVLSVNLKTLHMLSERLQKQPVQLEDLLRDAISEGVNSHTVLGEMIEVFVTRRTTKPPAR
jgi:predicted transcriptional regulator